MNKKTAKKIHKLRNLIKQHKLDALIVPTADPHQTEYVHDHWKCREWLSGFTGSAGTVVILPEKAGLWTDGRYFIQAEQELENCGIELFKDGMPDVPKLIDWVCEQVPENGKVGVDGRQITVKQSKEWETKFEKKNIRLITDQDLVSNVWNDRPALSGEPLFLHGIEYAGQSTADKLAEIRDKMQEKDADSYLLNSLYNIAWLFNLRGNDIPTCPVFMAYALITADDATLFIDDAKLTDEVRSTLDADGVTTAAYKELFPTLEKLPDDRAVYLDDSKVNIRLKQSIPEACKIVTGKDLADLPKARKNKIQIDHWRTVQELDGTAMVRYWKWLEENVPQGGVTECTAADQLEQFRRSHSECTDLSFSSISAFGPNAAMMHYFPRPETCAALEPRGLYLIDSGGQYPGGTTDITRTMVLGELTDEERTDYTLTLRGLIALSSARFLKGAAGNNLDILARQPLWEHGIDYKCGTGHGVGQFLSVHEGPQGISQSKLTSDPFEPGMILTIEPGVYREGKHGIRIENMVVVEEDCETESGTFYRFGTLTLFPIDTEPLKTELMTDKEIDWLNSYHQTVFEKLSPRLDPQEVEWLKTKTMPITADESGGS